MSTIVILGGGISGLSAVYYLQRLTTRFKKIILLESSERLGGWVNSRRYDDGTIFELGPRSLRPAGAPGINSVDLTEELGLETEVLAVSASAAASRNRFIYMNDRLNQVPNGIMSVIRTVPPFSQPLMLTVMKEMFKKKLEVEDESIHSFISRRFGEELANTAVDPIFRGIFAGDIRQLSVKSCMPEIFKMEQKHGSIVKGIIKSKRKPFRINSSLYLRCRKEKWLSWSLRQGLQTLTEQMEAAIRQSPSVDIRMQTPCQQITESHGKYLVKTDRDEIDADHVISAVPAKNLSAMLTRDHADLSGHLSRISAASVVLISMEYEGNVVAQPGFGHLLPSSEDKVFLGVVYDSCAFPEHDRKEGQTTRLTVMMGGAWFDDLVKASDGLDENVLKSMATKAVSHQLNIHSQPNTVQVHVLNDCIPQYYVGHDKNLDDIDAYISRYDLPLSLVGASYHGPSVNNCIFNSRKAVESLIEQKEEKINSL